MYWNDHKALEGTHAFLGASTYSLINWNDVVFEQRFKSQYATTMLFMNLQVNILKVEQN